MDKEVVPMCRVCVFCGSKSGNDPRIHEMTRELAGDLARRGRTLVYGGGSVGLPSRAWPGISPQPGLHQDIPSVINFAGVRLPAAGSVCRAQSEQHFAIFSVRLRVFERGDRRVRRTLTD